MSSVDIIRAWKDEEYRNSLSPAQRATLPPSPAGIGEMNPQAMTSIVGGSRQIATEFAVQPRAQAVQTHTVGTEVCCSTGDLSCGGGGSHRHDNWINLLSVSM